MFTFLKFPTALWPQTWLVKLPCSTECCQHVFIFTKSLAHYWLQIKWKSSWFTDLKVAWNRIPLSKRGFRSYFTSPAKLGCIILRQTNLPFGAPLVAQMVRNPPAMWETWVWSMGWEDPLEEGMATHSSVLYPMDRGAWQVTVHGVAKSGTRLSD